ncbi:unnamed protein product, partial [Mesorhabditis belari]|uniref:Uncharacterized protein n=1 Tax=Mesorhabditis belari TaxID=2138241 RepID=A0AAF3F5G6_9BILA
MKNYPYKSERPSLEFIRSFGIQSGRELMLFNLLTTLSVSDELFTSTVLATLPACTKCPARAEHILVSNHAQSNRVSLEGFPFVLKDTRRNWAPGEPSSDMSVAYVAKQYLSGTNPQGGASLPIGSWDNFGFYAINCAALCEVITAQSGNGCGVDYKPCAAAVMETPKTCLDCSATTPPIQLMMPSDASLYTSEFNMIPTPKRN